MPRESSVLADICCDFCFPGVGAPFTRRLTTTGTRTRVRVGLLMKAREASRRETSPPSEERVAVACAFPYSLFPHKVHVLSLFLNVAAFVAAIIPTYSRRLNQSL